MNQIVRAIDNEFYLVIADCCTAVVAHVYQIRLAYKTLLVCNIRFVCSIQWVWRHKLVLNQLLNLIVNYRHQNQAPGYRVEIVVFHVRCSAFETILAVELELKLEHRQNNNRKLMKNHYFYILFFLLQNSKR